MSSNRIRAAAYVGLCLAASRTTTRNPDPLDRAQALCERADYFVAHALAVGYAPDELDRDGFLAVSV